MKRKILSVLLGVAMVATLLSGCGAPAEDTATDETKTEDAAAEDGKTVVYWSMWSEGEAQANILTKAAEQYKEDTGVTIDIQFKGRTGNREALLPALDAGQQIDMFDEAPDRIVQNYSEHVMDVTDLVTDFEAEHGNPALYSLIRSYAEDGKLYGLPYQPSMTGMFYNKQIFADAGIDAAPQTWDEYEAACEKLLAAGVTPLTMDDAYATLNLGTHLERYVGQEGIAKLLDGSMSWDDPKVMEALTDMEDFAKKGYYSATIASNTFPAGQNQEFAIGMAAMNYNGAWLPNEVKDTKSEWDWGFFNYPTVEGGASSISTNHLTCQVIGVNKNSEVAEEAVGFIEYITSGAVDMEFVEAALCIPTDKANTEWPVELAEVKTQYEATTDDILWAAGVELNQDLTPVIKDATIKLMSGGMTAQEFADAANAVFK